MWDDRRPWRRASHLSVAEGVVWMDLHDLKARNAREALRELLAIADDLQGPAVVIVTGRGRHSLGPPVLHQMTGDVLRSFARDRDCAVLPRGSGAWVLVLDESRLPRSLRAESGLWLTVFFVLMLIAFAWVAFFP